MNYETFLNTVKSALEERLANDSTVIINRVPKNNGVVLDGLCIKPPSASLVPTIYLNDYYTAFEQGLPMEAVLDDLLSLTQDAPVPADLIGCTLTSPDQYLDRVIYRLVNAPANEALLLDVPHVLFRDLELALIFYVYLEGNESGHFFSLIHNSQTLRWSLSTELLYKAACANTPRLLPPAVTPLSEVLKDFLRDSLGQDTDEALIASLAEMPADSFELYVLSNTDGNNGSCCLFYDSIIKDFADLMDSDLIILPSSIHEVLLTPDRGVISYETLYETVLAVNQEELPPSDRLSNHIYRYRREEGQISIALRSPLRIG